MNRFTDRNREGNIGPTTMGVFKRTQAYFYS